MISTRKYQEVLALLQETSGSDLALVAETTSVDYDAIASIYHHQQQVEAKRSHPIHQSKIVSYVRMWESGKSLLDVARAVGTSPFLLFRMMFEAPGLMPFRLSSKEIASCLKDHALLVPHSPRLAREVEALADVVDSYSASSTRIRQAVGDEYEVYLQQQLNDLGVPYESEETLRAQGMARTPDVLLHVPILVDGFPIHWIDSKAMFGDPHTHAAQTYKQYLGYVNRFGPGLVIYWFGYVDGLNRYPASLRAGSRVSELAAPLSPSALSSPVAITGLRHGSLQVSHLHPQQQQQLAYQQGGAAAAGASVAAATATSAAGAAPSATYYPTPASVFAPPARAGMQQGGDTVGPPGVVRARSAKPLLFGDPPSVAAPAAAAGGAGAAGAAAAPSAPASSSAPALARLLPAGVWAARRESSAAVAPAAAAAAAAGSAESLGPRAGAGAGTGAGAGRGEGHDADQHVYGHPDVLVACAFPRLDQLLGS